MEAMLKICSIPLKKVLNTLFERAMAEKQGNR